MSDFAEMVEALTKPGVDIVRSMSPLRAHTLHMAVGISGEAGELLDAVKKHVIYDKPADRENIVEELGDLEFYMEGLRSGLGITREETLAHCQAKLAKRYASGSYSNKAAQERADKVDPEHGTLENRGIYDMPVNHTEPGTPIPMVTNFGCPDCKAPKGALHAQVCPRVGD